MRKLLQKTKMEMMVACRRQWCWQWEEVDGTEVFGVRSDKCGHWLEMRHNSSVKTALVYLTW